MQAKFLLTLLVASLFAVQATSAPKGDFETKDNQIVFHSPSSELRVQLCTEGMFRVSKVPSGAEFAPDEAWMVTKYDFAPIAYKARKTKTGYEISTAKLRIILTSEPWRVEVRKTDGSLLYKELDSRLGVPANRCALEPDEHFFGFGERMDFLDQRGHKVHLNVELGSGPKPAVGGKDILRANYCPVPLFMSNKGYSIFFHTAYPSDWDMGWSDKESYTYSADGGELDYYFIAGESVESMLASYQTLTGISPMMPRSAYGLHVGSYSGGTWHHEECTSDQYPVDLVHRFRKEQIPFDILWLDSTRRHFNERFGNGGCSFEFRETFKNPQAMIDSVYAAHVDMFGLHIRSIVDDGLHNTLFEDAVKAGAVIPKAGSAGTINFFDPKAVDWWWDNGASRLAKMGIKFVKTDVGSALRFQKDAALPFRESASELHNLFPIAYAKGAYEKFQQYNGGRGFNHTREGYAGVQRYPFIWAGDWGTEWQWFEPVIRGGLNIALSGVGYWSHCMGGFEQYSPYDTDLYLRWCQFGMFSPVAILFGMDHPRYHEPWTYGEEAMKIFQKYDNLRYSLIPYIYSNAYKMWSATRPLMTPLLYDYFDDALTYDISDQFMFGESMMICPVTNKGALSRPVYFPGGCWVDFWTGERLEGRQYKSFLTPIDIMPIFLKEGSIIPRQEPQQYMGERPVDIITLLIYPSTESEYQLYEDDGRSLDYEKGVYALTDIRSTLTDGHWELTIGKPKGEYKAQSHKYLLDVFYDGGAPSEVLVDGVKLPQTPADAEYTSVASWYYETERAMLHVNTGKDNSQTIKISVK